jgi:hypothetical protein
MDARGRTVLFIVTAAALACRNPVAYTTGLTGTVLRSPTAPICLEGDPCEAPVSAHFIVLAGTRAIAQFHSDADGHFAIGLAPGTYAIKPGADEEAIMNSPQSVTVMNDGFTTVRLVFDTGLR